MIDIHCHILPAIDDGPPDATMAAEMCRMAAEDGIRHIVATPHANDVYSYERTRVQASVEELSAAAGPALSFSAGCDFHLSFENIQDALLHPERYAIGNTKYLLIELSDFSLPTNMVSVLGRLQSAGLRPILTHPERNPMIQRRPEMVLAWVRAGCVVQVTANSFTGRWGDRALQVARFLLERDALHVLATDAHNTKGRPPVLSEGRDVVAKIGGQDVATALVEGNPGAIVNGLELPFFPQPRESK